MSRDTKPLSRRDFLKGSGCVALGIAAGLPALAEEAPVKATPPTRLSRVVLIRDAEATDAEGNPRGEVLESMLDQGMAALFREKDRKVCWGKIVTP